MKFSLKCQHLKAYLQFLVLLMLLLCQFFIFLANEEYICKSFSCIKIQTKKINETIAKILSIKVTAGKMFGGRN